jgi:formylglycine-generating enzyme required for sulfatase activity
MPSDPPSPTKSNDLIIRPSSGLINLSKSGTALSEQRIGGEELEFEIAAGVKLVMCWIPPGEFLMGSPEDEEGRVEDETQHRVMITQGFWLAKTPTTQAQWKAVMGSNPSDFLRAIFTANSTALWKAVMGKNPSEFRGDTLPVESVSWNDVCGEESGTGGFLGELNRRVPEGVRFRLPTEAQWEYACRAGTTGPYAGRLDEMGWYNANSGGRTHPVGQKKPNAWGLHDMHGNVWECCADWRLDYDLHSLTDPTGPADGFYSRARVIRGGCWLDGPAAARSANREEYLPHVPQWSYFGFRLAADAPERPYP